MNRKRIYLLLPVFAILAFSFGSVSFAKDVDEKDLKAESKPTLTAEIKEESGKKISKVVKADVRKPTEKATVSAKEESKANKPVDIPEGTLTKEMQERAMNYYNIIYPSEKARALWDDNVGMEKGMGAWQDIYKPVP